MTPTPRCFLAEGYSHKALHSIDEWQQTLVLVLFRLHYILYPLWNSSIGQLTLFVSIVTVRVSHRLWRQLLVRVTMATDYV